MNKLDFDRAFGKTPDCIHSAIEMGIRKGQKKMKMRNKIISMASVAAGFAIAIAVAALAAGGFDHAPTPDVLTQPPVTDAPMLTEEPMIYCTERGNYYHYDENCSGMEGARHRPLSEAQGMGKDACPVCVSTETAPAEPDPKAELFAEATVFCTEGGSYYHSDADCSGMLNANAISLSEAISMEKEACPRCLSPAFVFTTPHGNYYHSVKDCSGMEGATAMNPEEALWWDKHPCPVCITGKEVNISSSDMYYHESASCSAAEFYYDKYPLLDALTIGMTPCPECTAVEVAPEEENQDAFWADATLTQKNNYAEAPLEFIYYSESGSYYHSDADCSGMLNAVSALADEARSRGKMRCPVCLKTIPENYDLFTTAFGQEIENLYPGYIYECTNYGFEWIISNGEECFLLCDVHPQGTAFFGEELPGLPELYMTNLPADRIHEFMESVPSPIGDMYTAASAEMEKQLQHSKLTIEELQLQEITVYFDANRQVHACEMQFGFGDHVKLKWQVNTDGEIELTNGEFVDTQWG